MLRASWVQYGLAQRSLPGSATAFLFFWGGGGDGWGNALRCQDTCRRPFSDACWIQAAGSGQSPAWKIQFRKYSSVTNVSSAELVHVKMSPLAALDISLTEDKLTASPIQHGATCCQLWRLCCWLSAAILSQRHIYYLMGYLFIFWL